MDATHSLLAFAAAAAIMTMTPGIDTAMVLRSAAAGGARQAILAAIGISLGCLAWGAAVALGLGAVLAASTLAFTILKFAGAAYLMWLGVKLLVSPRNRLTTEDVSDAGLDVRRALRRGLLTNLLNPKVGVFYITFLPQFVPHGAEVVSFSFLLACIHVLLGMLWFGALIAAAVPFGRFLARGAVVRTLDRITGGIFVAFGLRLALARQP
jgi:threonine/homoserine/homoserine lactone efflux protein